MWFPVFNQSLHRIVVKWIGRNACHAGAVMGIGAACKGAQSLNMGMVVLAVTALALTATWLNVRRKRRRTEYFW
jgi:hypothetical protein